MTRKEKRNTALRFLCALIWAGVGCAWFIRAYQGMVGTPWFDAVLGLACLATGGAHAYQGMRDILRTGCNKNG